MTTRAQVSPLETSHREGSPSGPLVGAALAFGLAFLCVDKIHPVSHLLRAPLMALTAALAGLALLGGVRARATPRSRHVALLSCGVLVVIGVQTWWQDDLTHGVPYLIAAALTTAAMTADLNALMRSFIVALGVVIVISLMPLLVQDGFDAGRTWIAPIFPGRYYSFYSHPNALGILAGVGIVGSFVLRRKRIRVAYLTASTLLLVASASWTSLVAAACGLVILLLPDTTWTTRALSVVIQLLTAAALVATFSLLTPRGLAYISDLQQAVDATGRTDLWVHIVAYQQGRPHALFGIGELALGRVTTGLEGVGTAHSSFLQLLLSRGTVGVLLVIACLNACGRAVVSAKSMGRRDRSVRVLIALATYWFVVALVSAEPAEPLGLAVFVCLAVAAARGVDDASADLEAT